jgi:hypothetical protein
MIYVYLLLTALVFATYVTFTREAIYVWRNDEAHSRNHSCSEKAVSITYFCVCLCECGCMARACACTRVALIIQHDAQAPNFLLEPLTRHDIFRHYLINKTIFGKKLLNRKYVLWFSLLSLFETLFVLRRIQQDVIIYVKTCSRKVPVIFVGMCWNLSFLDGF